MHAPQHQHRQLRSAWHFSLALFFQRRIRIELKLALHLLEDFADLVLAKLKRIRNRVVRATRVAQTSF